MTVSRSHRANTRLAVPTASVAAVALVAPSRATLVHLCRYRERSVDQSNERAFHDLVCIGSRYAA